MKIKELPKEQIKTFIVKYDYEDCTGFGAVVVYAPSPDAAVIKFRNYMFDNKTERWMDHMYRRSNFRHVSCNIFGWHQYFNDDATVCLKVREIDTKYGDIIPIQESFEDARIDHLM